ncbi:MAG: YdcF family protein [Holophagae bacterium]
MMAATIVTAGATVAVEAGRRMTPTAAWTIADRPPVQPGCFVVPSYALRSAATPTLPTRAALDVAASWHRRFPSAPILVSTGDNQRLGVTNASVMAAYLSDHGVPTTGIIEEDQSLNTFENLTNCGRIIEKGGFTQPTLVTLDLYTRRAVAVAQKLGWDDVRWISVRADGEPAAGWKWFQTYSRATIFIYEVAAMVYCRLRGWI